MSTLSHTFTSTEAPGAASATFFLRNGQSADWTAVGTIDAGCQIALQRQVGSAWVDVKRWPASAVNTGGRVTAENGNQTYRFLADVPTTDPATTLASFACTLADQVNVLEEVRSPSGTRVFAMTDEGIEAPKVTTDTIAEKTSAAGVTIDGVQAKDGGINATASLRTSAGSAAGAIAANFGNVSTEGLTQKVLEETISFAANTDLAKALTAKLPAGAVVLSAQANIQAAITGGGTTAKLGVGIASDPDKYGKTSALTKNAKITTLPDWAVIASEETVGLYACAADGSAGDTALTVGSARVRIVFLVAVDLANAP